MPDIDTTTTTANTPLIQPGWRIYSLDGEAIGEVIAVDATRIVLRGDAIDAPRLELPSDSIIEQEEAEMRARVSLTADEIGPTTGTM